MRQVISNEFPLVLWSSALLLLWPHVIAHLVMMNAYECAGRWPNLHLRIEQKPSRIIIGKSFGRFSVVWSEQRSSLTAYLGQKFTRILCICPIHVCFNLAQKECQFTINMPYVDQIECLTWNLLRGYQPEIWRSVPGINGKSSGFAEKEGLKSRLLPRDLINVANNVERKNAIWDNKT